MRWLGLTLLALAAAPDSVSQSEGLLQVEDDVHLFLERQRTLGTLSDPELGARPLSTYRAHALLDSLAARDAGLSALDRARLATLRGTTTGGLFGPAVARRTALYRDGRSFARVEGDVPGGSSYALEIEPLLFTEAGIGRQTDADGADPTPFVYYAGRGIRSAGRLGRVFFDGRVQETQRRRPLGDSGRRTAPRLGAVTIRERGPAPVYDYLDATGVIGYTGPAFEARFGRDRNRWGLGRESVVLSDYAAPYDQLQLRWRVWRVAFQSLLARPVEPPVRDGFSTVHYVVSHRLAIDLGAGVEVEAFESVAFGPDTTGLGRRDGFEVAYLNPFQFFRSTERDIGSPDNVLLGAGAAWRPVGGARLYAQGILDELVSASFTEDDWRNKWAFLVGADVSDPGVPGLGRVRGLDLGVEYARLRPYLYSHRSALTAYTHSGDGLGHPAGPNASDLTVSARYRPLPDWEASFDVVRTVRGRNTPDQNVGSEPTRPYTDRIGNTGIETLQGIRQVEWLVEAQAGVRLLPDATAGLALRARSIDDALDGRRRYAAPLVYLRWGRPYASDRF